MSDMSSRPKFSPDACPPQSVYSPLYSTDITWVPLIECPANFPEELFDTAVSQLAEHPEYNSTLILRSETVSDNVDSSQFSSSIPDLRGFQKSRCIHRKLLARRPGRDSNLEQYCTLYREASGSNTVLILTPITSESEPLPYYHPRVSHLAFRYLNQDSSTAGDVHDSDSSGLLRIEVVPLPDTPLDQGSRLFRTCLALLDTLHRYGWGAMTSYQKRVIHDVLIPREHYQDLYLVMRERHKGLVDTWQEVTDPLKHVFEDIGIATYLMLLWRISFGGDNELYLKSDEEPWKSWPRPPGGFLDLGCGNGLLVHILIAEGYEGHGIDLRERTSWKSYPITAQNHLHVYAFNPLESSPSTTGSKHHGFFLPGVFIIANHADELTPWTPVLSTLYSASGYLSIPCCAWDLDCKYQRDNTKIFPIPGSSEANSDSSSSVKSESESASATLDSFIQKLHLGGEGANSRSSSYSMYRIWLATLSAHTGWQVECETLRIPSTRNWAIVGRKRTPLVSNEEAMRNVEEIIRNVKERALFRPRQPEGKGNH